jgi:hypothetical protein
MRDVLIGEEVVRIAPSGTRNVFRKLVMPTSVRDPRISPLMSLLRYPWALSSIIDEFGQRFVKSDSDCGNPK